MDKSDLASTKLDNSAIRCIHAKDDEGNYMKEDESHHDELNQFRKRRKLALPDPIDRQFSRGCEWSGELNELKTHLERECSHTLESCPNEDCEILFRRKDKEQHLRHCMLRRGNFSHEINIL